MNIKDWGGGDLEDVAAAARYLQRLPDVDPGRIGIFGGSYGGYMTYMAVTKKPDLWKAAVAWVGITDLHKLYEEDLPHFKDYFREQMGDPVADRDLWRERSAITYADQLTAKLLIVHGHTDPRCPITQARIFRERLLELGRTEGEDFEYVEFADEGHGSQDIKQKLRFYGLLEDFFARRL
jgi:dipeptidyl aminopeptidase/acylaminoacyl peptidase